MITKNVKSFEGVLISTYWNVNSGSTVVEHNEQGVLISTYWNVNKSAFFV